MLTLIDQNGKIYRQVYGDNFELPALGEPLKKLVGNVQTQYPGCDPRNGDVNGDGTYPSFKDINPFVALLGSTTLPIACP